MRWIGRIVSFVVPVAFLTAGSWGLLLAGMFAVSLFRPFEVPAAFERIVWPYSTVVFIGIGGFALWLRHRLRRPGTEDRR